MQLTSVCAGLRVCAMLDCLFFLTTAQVLCCQRLPGAGGPREIRAWPSYTPIMNLPAIRAFWGSRHLSRPWRQSLTLRRKITSKSIINMHCNAMLGRRQEKNKTELGEEGRGLEGAGTILWTKLSKCLLRK